MRIFGALLLIAILVSALPEPQAQAQSENSPGGPTVLMQDGGGDQVLQSIYIPPIPNAPFTAIVHTQWIRSMIGGGTYTLVNERRVARDQAGRIYEERWLLVPKDGKWISQMNVIQIADPAARTLLNCFLLQKPHSCVVQQYDDSPTANYRPSSMQTGALANGDGFLTHEDLGIRTIAGIDTQGIRDTVTYNRGVIGNDRTYDKVREFWFAPSLAINLRSEVTSPDFGQQIFNLTDIGTADPDPKLFEIPNGFKVVDRRMTATPNQ